MPVLPGPIEGVNPPPPTILHEYQNKGLTEFAIRK